MLSLMKRVILQMAKTLFDHIKGVTKNKIKWEALSVEDRKSFNNFLISRWFSMDLDLVEIINGLQKYTNGILDPSDYYRVLYDIMPQSFIYLKYIKRKNKVEIDNEFMDLLCKHYQASKRVVYDYIRIIKESGSNELIDVLQLYGTPVKEIEKFKKQLKTVK